MDVKKLKKLNDIAMALNDLRKTAPPVFQEAIGMVITYLIEQMLDEVEK
jgi:hypothetical protein